MTYLLIAALALVLCSNLSDPFDAPRRRPKTIVDYFLLLPNDYFEVQTLKERLDLARRESSIIDVSNGFLFMKGDGAQRDLTVCLFKRRNGLYLLAVGDNAEHGVFDGLLDFYVYRGDRLRQFKGSELPLQYDRRLVYVLPRTGRTIRVKSRSGRDIRNLIWTGDEFRRSS